MPDHPEYAHHILPSVRCTSCGAWADTVYFPDLVGSPEDVRFACPDHDPERFYRYRLDAFAELIDRKDWLRILDKNSGLHAVAALATALADEHDRCRTEERELSDSGHIAREASPRHGEEMTAREQAFREEVEEARARREGNAE